MNKTIVKTFLFSSLFLITVFFGASFADEEDFLQRKNKKLEKKQPLLLRGNLENFINRIRLAERNGKDQFFEPSLRELSLWKKVIKLSASGNFGEATFLAEKLNYEGIIFSDNHKKEYFVLREKNTNFRGFGVFVFNPRAKRKLVFEVPHPLNDLKTREQGSRVFIELQASALLIAGTDRCLSCQPSWFDGETTVCNDSCSLSSGFNRNRISDAAHYQFNFFHYAHEALFDYGVKFHFLQLHGATAESLGLDRENKKNDFILSQGTIDVPDKKNKILFLHDELERVGLNSAIYGRDTDKLGATTNLQGRYTNGKSTKNCIVPCQANGFFLHLEQSSYVRNSPRIIVEVLSKVFPENSD